MKCWQTLNNFGQFCEKIRGIHQNLIEVSDATGIGKYEENDEELLDDVEEHISTEEQDEVNLPLLSIESDLGDDGDTLTRGCELNFDFISF